MSSILTALVDPLTEEQFFDRHWPSEPLVHAGSLERLPFLAEMRELFDRVELSKRWQGTIRAWPKPGSGLPELDATPDQTEALYRAGYTLFFGDIEKRISSVRRLFNRFADEVGVDPADVCCEAFYSPKGAGAAPHFDGNWGFNIQLSGDKEWEIAPNRHVEFPEAGAPMGSRTDPRLLGYATFPFPTEMPADSRTFEVRAGSVVFVPCGMWHRTKVLTDSAAVVMTIKPRSWTKVVGDELGRRLNRRLAVARSTPLLGARSLRPRLAQEIRLVIDELRATADELDADELLDALIGARHCTFAVKSNLEVTVSERAGELWDFAVVQRGKRFESRIERSNGEVLRWTVGRGGEFSFTDLCDAFPNRAADELLERIGDLERARLLQRSAAI